MTDARFTKICRDIEKIGTKMNNSDTDKQKFQPILGGLSVLTDEQLEDMLYEHFERKYNLTREQIEERLTVLTTI